MEFGEVIRGGIGLLAALVLGYVAVDNPIRSREHVQCIQRTVCKLCASEVVDARCEEACEVDVGNAGRGVVPIDHGRITDLVAEGRGSGWLLFAIYGKGREEVRCVEEARSF